MKKKIFAIVLAFVLMFTFTACGGEEDTGEPATDETSEIEEGTDEPEDGEETAETEDDELIVSAAASLTESMEELEDLFYEKEGIRISTNLESSGKLQKQIEEGAPADVFISAGQSQMDALREQGLVDEDTVDDLLENVLVVIQPDDTDKPIDAVEDLKDFDGRIAVAETETVPVGQYTRQTLENLDIWDDIQDNVVTAKDVKATLAYVDQGEVDAGFVYKSDAEQAERSKIAVEVDNSLHDPIIYPEAVVSASENKENARKFLDFLHTDDAKAVFEKYGFKVVE